MKNFGNFLKELFTKNILYKLLAIGLAVLTVILINI